MSQLEARAGRPKESLAQLEEAVRADPNSKLALVTVARVYLLTGDPRRASEMLQAEMQKTAPTRRCWKSWVAPNWRLASTGLAIPTFRMLVQLQRDAAQARQYLAEAYEERGADRRRHRRDGTGVVALGQMRPR